MELLTTLEVAKYLRVKERTVYEMVSRQQIPCSRATGKLLFSRTLIDAWIEANTEMPAGVQQIAPPIYAGSSDPLLEWSLRQSGAGLAVLSQGSQNGLEKIAAGEAILAGIHIRDAETGLYNLKPVRNALPQNDIVVIHWAKRTLGLIVASGNPHRISGLRDLIRPGVTIARRIEGAGSMVLLRGLLEREGMSPEALRYSRMEAETESDLSDMIAQGDADCALGVASAVRGQDFIPLWPGDEFDLVLRRRDYFEAPVQSLLKFTNTCAFRKHATHLGGYDLQGLGDVRHNA